MSLKSFFSLLVALIAFTVLDNVSAGFISRVLVSTTRYGVEATGRFKLFLGDLRNCLNNARSGTKDRPWDTGVAVLTLRYGILTLKSASSKTSVGQLVLVDDATPLGKVTHVEGSIAMVETLWSQKLNMPVEVGEKGDVVLFEGGNPPTIEVLDDTEIKPGMPLSLVEYPTLPEASSVIGRVGQYLGGKRYTVELSLKPGDLSKGVSLFP